MLHGLMQNHAGPKNMCKKTRKKSPGQSSMGGVFSHFHDATKGQGKR